MTQACGERLGRYRMVGGGGAQAVVADSEDWPEYGAMETDIIARAYQLAAESSHLEDIRIKLKREGYASVDSHLASGRLRAELKKLLKKPGA